MKQAFLTFERWTTFIAMLGACAMLALAALALIGIIIWWGWDYAQRGGVQSMAGLESVSMFWAYLAMPVGGLFCVVGIIGNLVDPLRMELETAQ